MSASSCSMCQCRVDGPEQFHSCPGSSRYFCFNNDRQRYASPSAQKLSLPAYVPERCCARRDFVRALSSFVFNEWVERIVDVCESYVLDVDARGRDWSTELAGTRSTLRSQVNMGWCLGSCDRPLRACDCSPWTNQTCIV